MTLPAPKLDDRSFQDLVDDAKRFIQERCPEWTDHNVSDPGVTLIEAFAWMTDLTLYRLNRVPDRLYVKFLELLGVTLFPPKAASVEVDFFLSAVNPGPVPIPKGTVVSTKRTATETPVDFSTIEDVEILPVVVDLVLAQTGDDYQDMTQRLGMDAPTKMFNDVPQPDDALVLVLDRPAPLHSLRLNVEVVKGAGYGVREARPPLRWEASTGEGWSPCIATDNTGGFNYNGTVELRLPVDHALTDFPTGARALVRCRVVPPTESMPAYESSPELLNLTGGCVGAAVPAVNAVFVEGESLGESTGIASQEFRLQNAPVVISDEAFVLHVSRPPLTEDLAEEGSDLPRDEPPPWEQETWELRQDFADSSPEDRHFTLDRATGVIRFGPTVRGEDGRFVQYGAVPPKNAFISVPRYRVGGGRRGNVAVAAVSVLRSSVPYVDRVTNLAAARGGVDGETVEEARVRGPLQLRARNRAVTAEDFEVLTREAAPEVRRVRCVADDGDDPSAVRVLMVPNVATSDGRVDLRDLLPGDDTNAAVQEYLDRRRLVGTRVRVEPPAYLGFRVKASVSVGENHLPQDVRFDAFDALYRYFNPVEGGPDGRGWPFGRSVRIGEVYTVLQQVGGVDVVTGAELFFCNPRSGEEEQSVGDVLRLSPNQLFVSNGHEITVVEER